MKSPIEQKSSDLLTKDENETVFRLLGNKCQVSQLTYLQYKHKYTSVISSVFIV